MIQGLRDRGLPRLLWLVLLAVLAACNSGSNTGY